MDFTKKMHIATVAAFLAVIAVPCVWLFHEPGAFLPNENRMATALPQPKTVREAFDPAAWEAFFNDNVGLRNFAATADPAVKYTLFGFIPDEHKIQGESAQTYYTPYSKYKPTGIAPYGALSGSDLAQCAANIQVLADDCAARGVPFTFVTIPNKEEIYPETYPASVLQKPETSRMAQLTAHLLEWTEIDAFDLTEPLRARKAEDPQAMLYNESGDAAHWNARGAFTGYRAILAHLQEDDPTIPALEESDFDVTETVRHDTTGDGRFVYAGLTYTVYDYAPKRAFAAACYDEETEPSFPIERLQALGYDSTYYHFVNPEREGTLLIIGDSYLHEWNLPYFGESFGEVYFFYPASWEIMHAAADLVQPDRVILETVDRMYQGMLFGEMQGWNEWAGW